MPYSPGTTHTVAITRTVEIDVTVTVYPEHKEIEIDHARDCDTDKPIELTETEIDEVHQIALPDFHAALQDAADDAREEQRRFNEWETKKDVRNEG